MPSLFKLTNRSIAITSRLSTLISNTMLFYKSTKTFELKVIQVFALYMPSLVAKPVKPSKTSSFAGRIVLMRLHNAYTLPLSTLPQF